jgi:hypothetical protein
MAGSARCHRCWRRTTIVHIGSSEQNGPHLVIGKHTAVAGNAFTRTGHMRFPGRVAAELRERQIAELVEDNEVHASEVVGTPALPRVAGLALDPADEIDEVVEAAAVYLVERTCFSLISAVSSRQ